MSLWDVSTPVSGHCQQCGDDLGTPLRVRATAEWVQSYQHDERLRRSVERAVVRLVVARHATSCAGAVALHQRTA
ncbi:MAG: hypothetical protein ABI068_06790 [Ktedonobacterales bacterium]